MHDIHSSLFVIEDDLTNNTHYDKVFLIEAKYLNCYCTISLLSSKAAAKLSSVLKNTEENMTLFWNFQVHDN